MGTKAVKHEAVGRSPDKTVVNLNFSWNEFEEALFQESLEEGRHNGNKPTMEYLESKMQWHNSDHVRQIQGAGGVRAGEETVLGNRNKHTDFARKQCDGFSKL